MEALICIDDYLSEGDKIELAQEVFRERIRTELFKNNKGTVQSDSEIQRIIGNITHHIVFEEVQKYIPDFKNLIIDKAREAIEKGDLAWEIFRKKSAWDDHESLGITYLTEAIKANKETLYARVEDVMMNHDFVQDIINELGEVLEDMASKLIYFRKPKGDHNAI